MIKYLSCIVVIGALFIYQQAQINYLKHNLLNTELALINVSDSQKESNEQILSMTKDNINALQDSLEERIGNIERDNQDLKFIFGNRKHKGK
jgi:hypothetical protein